MNILQKPVPSFTKGRREFKPEGIVIHIGEGTQEIIYQTFLHEDKSSHYCVSKLGEVWQFVKEEDTAWAQGAVVQPTAKLVTDIHPGINPNKYLISIEHEGFGGTDFTDAQYQTTAQLVKDISTRWNIPLDSDHVIRHNSIRRDKSCPGKADVDKIISLAQEGVSLGNDELKRQIIELVNKIK